MSYDKFGFAIFPDETPVDYNTFEMESEDDYREEKPWYEKDDVLFDDDYRFEDD